MEIKQVVLDGKTFSVSIERFDEDLDVEHGASYHGHLYNVVGSGIKFWFKKYDDDNEIGYFSDNDPEKYLVEILIKSITGNLDASIYSLKSDK